MASRESDQRVTIRCTQGSDHVDVVTTRTIERIREGIAIGANPVNLLRELLDRLDETGIATQLKQSPVKIKVAIEYREQIAAVDRSTVLALDVIELVDIAAPDGEGQNSNGHDLQFLAYRVDFCHFVRREVTHDRAAVRNSLDDALFFEFEECQPYVGTVRVELLAEILLDQPLARVTPTQYDVLFKAGCDDIGDGRLPRPVFRRQFARRSLRRSARASRRRLVPKCPASGHGQSRNPSPL